MVSCIVSATYPQSVQDQLQVPYKPLEGASDGFYFRPSSDEFELPSYLIVCSELPLLPIYYPLLVFAAGNKLDDFIDIVVDQGLEVYVKYLVKLHEETVTEALVNKRRGNMLTKGQRRFLDLGYEAFGYEGMTDRLIEQLEKLTPEEVETNIGEERLIKLFSALRPNLSENEIRELLGLSKEPVKRKRRTKADPTPPAESK